MNKPQLSKRVMFGRLIAFFDNHPSLESGLPRLQTALQEFRSNYSLIETASENQQADSRAATLQKEAMVKKLSYAFEHFSKVMRTYAFDNGLIQLEATYSMSRSRLLNMSDTILLDAVDLLSGQAAPYISNLQDYGYTQQDYAALQQLTADIKAMIPRRNTITDSKISATRDLGFLVKRNSELLEMVISPLMLSFKNADPALYEAFRTARKTEKIRGKEKGEEDDKGTMG